MLALDGTNIGKTCWYLNQNVLSLEPTQQKNRANKQKILGKKSVQKRELETEVHSIGIWKSDIETEMNYIGRAWKKGLETDK